MTPRRARGGRPASTIGTRKKTEDGRVLVKTEHGWEWETRARAEMAMGRRLRPGEKVRQAGKKLVVTAVVQVWPVVHAGAAGNSLAGFSPVEKTRRAATPAERKRIYREERAVYVREWRARRAAQ